MKIKFDIKIKYDQILRDEFFFKNKTNSKQIKSNQKNKNCNWNKNEMGGKLLIIARLAWISRRWEKKYEEKKIQMPQTISHASPH
jgi:hypothetical protein